MIASKPIRHLMKETCSRCGGFGNTGHRRCNGVCFRCNGLGYTMSEIILNVVPVEKVEPAPLTPVPMPDLSGENWIEALFAK